LTIDNFFAGRRPEAPFAGRRPEAPNLFQKAFYDLNPVARQLVVAGVVDRPMVIRYHPKTSRTRP